MFCAQLGHSEQALELLEESGADSVSESDAFCMRFNPGLMIVRNITLSLR